MRAQPTGFVGLVLALGALAGAGAQGLRARPLGPVEATSKDLFTNVSIVRALPDGHLLVLDVNGRKLMYVEPDLASWKPIADRTTATGHAYGGADGGLIRYLGDSSLFVDQASLTMYVIDGAGTIARVMAVPRPGDAAGLMGGPTGFPGVDAKGRLIYRGRITFPPPGPCAADGSRPMMTSPTTAPLVRIDLVTRTIDTVTDVRLPLHIERAISLPLARTIVMNPMPEADDWTVLPNGTVAVVRVTDYHMDLIGADGTVRSGAKVPFAWRRLDDSTKAAFVDSTKAAVEKLSTAQPVEIAEEIQTRIPGVLYGPCGPSDAGVAGESADVSARVDAARSAGRRTADPVKPPPIPFFVAGPAFLPDYAPPFAPGSTRADWDGNVWVRTSVVIDGGSVYDVLNGSGDLIDRLIAPPGRVIAGFGPNGAVYMGVREGTGTRLELARRK